jgi:hypothetical protein
LKEKGGGDLMNKKDLIIAVLATFCLTATLFIILPSRSAEPYNPWADVSGPTIGEPDGTINMRDINYEILRFNTFGDTAKNVTVTNWPSPKSQYELVKVGSINWTSSMTSYIFDDIYVGGYSRMELLVEATNASFWVGQWSTGFGDASLKWYKELGEGSRAFVHDPVSINLTILHDFGLMYSIGTPLIVETKAPYCSIYIKKLWDDGPGWWITMDFYLYLRNE